jgi:hypothetical protein
MLRTFLLLIAAIGLLCGPSGSTLLADDAAPALRPMRPLPVARKTELAAGPKKFVDAARGDDASAGTEAAPWKTLKHALRRLAPGDTLYLRAGIYYEKPILTKSGTEAAPITIAGYPGELATIDGSFREFVDSPATSWEPFTGGAADEYVSTRTYPDADTRRSPTHGLPGNWEPMLGKETERPLALGAFADSLVPLHGYRTKEDFRSKNEYWLAGKNEARDIGNYCGPGLWFDRDTARIHIRLAHTQLAGLEDRAYRGETDPRKLKLIVAAGFGDDVMRITGISHVTLRDLVFRGAVASPMLHVYGSHHITLDHLSVYGGYPALLLNAAQDIRVAHSAFRSLAAPWTSRAHMKYRGTPEYQVVLQNNMPINENIEIANCEFTDGHDFGFFRFVKNLQFHHNFVDNFNDDGLECGPKLRGHTLYIYENRIGRCLIPFSQHEFNKDESPVDHGSTDGVYAFRNVIDLRGGTYKSPPPAADSTGAYLHEEGHLVSDHGGPVWPLMRFYHNTILRTGPNFRDYYLFALGAQGIRNNERDVFNNILVQTQKVPGAGFAGITETGVVRAGGNILWGVVDGPQAPAEPFAKFRASKLFAASKKHYERGLTTDDRVADPQLAKLTADEAAPVDLTLRTTSPAIDAGLPINAAWPDPLRDSDAKQPDIGALPLGLKPWGVGVDGRLSLFGAP